MPSSVVVTKQNSNWGVISKGKGCELDVETIQHIPTLEARADDSVFRHLLMSWERSI